MPHLLTLAEAAAELAAAEFERQRREWRCAQPDSPFRTSLTDVSKSASGVSINSSLGNADTYDVEYSEDLISWDIIESGVTVSPYEDTDATRTANASGYYRIRE